MSYVIRSQTLVTHLEAWLNVGERRKQLQESARLKGLSGLLRRNGLLQTGRSGGSSARRRSAAVAGFLAEISRRP